MSDKGATTARAVSGDEEDRKRVEKVEVPFPLKSGRNSDTLRYMERKLCDMGLHRMERHPVDGLGLGHAPPKSGHGGKFTWEGPDDAVEAELNPVPPAIDPRDPNYVDETPDSADAREREEDNPVIGQVEVAKVAESKEGVARVEVRPPLEP